MSGVPPRVEVVVDELLLRGVPREQAHAVVAALEARVTALAGEWAHTATRTVPEERAEVRRRLPAVAAPAASPAALGDALATAVWGAVAPGGRP